MKAINTLVLGVAAICRQITLTNAQNSTASTDAPIQPATTPIDANNNNDSWETNPYVLGFGIPGFLLVVYAAVKFDRWFRKKAFSTENADSENAQQSKQLDSIVTQDGDQPDSEVASREPEPGDALLDTVPAISPQRDLSCGNSGSKASQAGEQPAEEQQPPVRISKRRWEAIVALGPRPR